MKDDKKKEERKAVENGSNNKLIKNMKLEFQKPFVTGDKKPKVSEDPHAQEGKQNSPPSEESKEERGREFFGVKSYLHNFYESVSIKNPQLYEDIYEEESFSAKNARKRRRAACCWKISLCAGSLNLVLGLLFLFIGYLTPHRDVIAGYQEDMEIIDRDATNFNYKIKLCRIIGLILFCSGGCIFCTVLLLSVLSNIQYDDDDEYQDSIEPFCVPPGNTASQSPTDKMIPANEELANVQPKRNISMVVTNAGLCKPPTLKSR